MAIANINAYNVNKTSAHLLHPASAKVRKLHVVRNERRHVTEPHASNIAPTVHRVERFGAIGRGPVRIACMRVALEMMDEIL